MLFPKKTEKKAPPTFDEVINELHGSKAAVYNHPQLSNLIGQLGIDTKFQEANSPTFTPEITREIFRKIRPRMVVELGVYRGGSSIDMGKALGELGLKDSFIVSIDTWLLDLRYTWGVGLSGNTGIHPPEQKKPAQENKRSLAGENPPQRTVEDEQEIQFNPTEKKEREEDVLPDVVEEKKTKFLGSNSKALSIEKRRAEERGRSLAANNPAEKQYFKFPEISGFSLMYFQFLNNVLKAKMEGRIVPMSSTTINAAHAFAVVLFVSLLLRCGVEILFFCFLNGGKRQGGDLRFEG